MDSKLLKFISSLGLFIVTAYFFYYVAKDASSDEDVNLNYGLDYYEKGNYTDAIPLLKQSADRGNELAYPFLGHSYLETQNYPAAVQYLEKADQSKAFQNEPNNLADIYYNLGIAYKNLGEEGEAKKYLQKSEDLRQ